MGLKTPLGPNQALYFVSSLFDKSGNFTNLLPLEVWVGEKYTYWWWGTSKLRRANLKPQTCTLLNKWKKNGLHEDPKQLRHVNLVGFWEKYNYTTQQNLSWFANTTAKTHDIVRKTGSSFA